MKKNVLLVLMLIAAFQGFAQTYSTRVYRTKQSGNWSSPSTWDSSGNAGTSWSSCSTTPNSGVLDIIVQTGHTLTLDTTRSCANIYINTGGSLISSKAIATGSNSLRPYGSIIQNDGVFGATGAEGIEILVQGSSKSGGVLAKGFVLSGSGTSALGRLRMAGGNTNALNLVIDQDVSFAISTNYALSAFYNGTVADNYSITIKQGKTVKLLGTAAWTNVGTSVAAGGNYTYNIDGTLDLSGSTANTSLVPLGNPASVITVNVNGLLKLGSGSFSTDTLKGVPGTAFGKVVVNVGSNGKIDARLSTSFKTGSQIGQYLMLSGNASLIRTVGATSTLFPIGTSATSYTPVTLVNSGTSDVFEVSLNNTFSNAPASPNSVVNKQWNITQLGTEAVSIKPAFGWLAADQASGFSPTGIVNIMRYASGWYNSASTVKGTGTFADPYLATGDAASLFSSFGSFGVTNGTVVPLRLLSFTGKFEGNIANLIWTTTNEVNTNSFVVERSINGEQFVAIEKLNTYNTVGTHKYVFSDSRVNTPVVYYRLRMVDNNGDVTYSNTITIRKAIIVKDVKLSVAPNPIVSNALSITHGQASAGDRINILSTNGKVVKQINVATSAEKTAINVTGLAVGVYMAQYQKVDGSTDLVRFVKQ